MHKSAAAMGALIHTTTNFIHTTRMERHTENAICQSVTSGGVNKRNKFVNV